MEVFRWLGNFLMVLTAAYLYFVIVEWLTSVYAAPSPEARVSSALLSGDYAWLFWLSVGLLVLAFVLQFGQFVSRRYSIPLMVLSGVVVNLAAVGMVPVAVILQCLARGAVAVGVTPCTGDCPLGEGEAIKGRLDYCRALLALLGARTAWVGFVGPRDRGACQAAPAQKGQAGPQRVDGPLPLFGPEALVSALRELAGETSGALAHHYSPLGILHLNPEKCSDCGICASACPTEALKLEPGEAGTALTCDASLCVACGRCSDQCPEAASGALRVEKVTDLARLCQGWVTLYRENNAQCMACGAPVAPKGMLRRIGQLLGEDNTALAGPVGRYCLACRGLRG